MNMKHTPGPWTVVGDGGTIEGEGGRRIAECVWWERRNGKCLEQDANALLMSLAPEMLEIVILAQALLDPEGIEASPDMISEWRNRARTAIAKAECK